MITLGRIAVATGVVVPASVLMASNVRPITRESHPVKISELPLYGEPEVRVKFVPEEIGPYRENVSVVRQALWPWRDSAIETANTIVDKYEIGKAHTLSTIDRIQSSEGTIPRICVITVSGLAGIVLGYKGGYIRRAAFSSFAMLTAASLCFPKEAVNITTNGYNTIKTAITGSDTQTPVTEKKNDD